MLCEDIKNFLANMVSLIKTNSFLE
uniref:Uncharacterized protein n=1 Tax=Arundo donax TaxID=35708 RepID=A0A0A9BH48_ARUDO